MEYENILSEAERKTRKIWLRLLVVPTCILMFLMLFAIPEGANGSKAESTPEIIAWFLGGLIAVSFCALPSWIVYRCAYKKPGTKLLTLQLVFFPFTIVGEIGELFLLIREIDAGDPVAVKFSILAFWVVSFAISVYWIIYSYRLRSINKKIKRYKASLQPQEQLQTVLEN